MVPRRRVGINPITEADLFRVHENTNRRVGPSGVLPDFAIRELVTIDPFEDYPAAKRKETISFGLSSAGYDLRVGYQFRVFTNARGVVVDPKSLDPAAYIEIDVTPKGEDRPGPIAIPPNSFALAATIETIQIPANVMCICLGKSSYARAGLNMNFTPFEPGWRGVVTVEIINANPNPVLVYPGEGIGQAVFFLMAAVPEKAYADKPGAKYQDQTGITNPRG